MRALDAGAARARLGAEVGPLAQGVAILEVALRPWCRSDGGTGASVDRDCHRQFCIRTEETQARGATATVAADCRRRARPRRPGAADRTIERHGTAGPTRKRTATFIRRANTSNGVQIGCVPGYGTGLILQQFASPM